MVEISNTIFKQAKFPSGQRDGGHCLLYALSPCCCLFLRCSVTSTWCQSIRSSLLLSPCPQQVLGSGFYVADAVIKTRVDYQVSPASLEPAERWYGQC